MQLHTSMTVITQCLTCFNLSTLTPHLELTYPLLMHSLEIFLNSLSQRQIIDWEGKLNHRSEDTWADLIQIEDGMVASFCSDEVMSNYSSAACKLNLYSEASWGCFCSQVQTDSVLRYLMLLHSPVFPTTGGPGLNVALGKCRHITSRSKWIMRILRRLS